ncbi:pyridoxamine 5'-phosphate oxidase family protein [Hyphomicrobiales bacterium]|nr:pyridoxamine 5'-phosphate oxidase family protein [Hyphomicrobiales bacterium]
MTRKISDDHPSLDLKKSLKFVLSTLEKGATERGHDFHLLVLGTLDEDNNPQTRNVVLRKVDLFQSLLRFHTDKRSNKILDIKNNNSISLLGYDKSNKLQIRIMAKAEIEDSRETLLDIWSNMYPMSRECYRVNDAPGKIVSSKDDVFFEEEGVDKMNGFENFTIVNCYIDSIETLFLHSSGHLRAKYQNENNQFTGQWLVP